MFGKYKHLRTSFMILAILSKLATYRVAKEVETSKTFTNYQPKKLQKQLPAMRFEFSKKEKFEKNEKKHKISKKLNISENFGFFSKS